MVTCLVFCVCFLVQIIKARDSLNLQIGSIDDRASRALCFLFGICSTAVGTQFAFPQTVKKLDTLFEWSQLEFDFPTEEERQLAIHDGAFIPGKPAPIDTDIYYGEQETKVFITIPRFQEGVPATLGTVTKEVRDGNPIIKPYPSWKWHKNPEACNTDRIISVYRVAIDECGRLWVLDTGRLVDDIICSPQLLVFDLKTDQLINRYTIPSNQYEPRSIIVTPIVDIRDTCENTFVYLADCQTYSIIVYDAQKDTSWIVTDKTMYPYPNYGTYSIKGDSFDLMDGIIGMAITPYVHGHDRKLFYHAMSSPTENFVMTSYLRNQSFIEGNEGAAPEIFHTYSGQRKTQSAAEAIDKNGIMYFGLMSDVKLVCFNTKGEYGDSSSMDIIANDQKTLQFASGVKIINNRNNEQELRVLTSRFQKVGAGTLNPSEVNFRILSGKTSQLLQGTRCVKSQKYPGGGYGLYNKS